ncbi:MAG: DUF4013 domain-containing protein [Thermomicrobiales bacterium]
MSATAVDRAFRLDFDQAISFVGRDRNWLPKLGLGALFSFLTVIIIGYVLIQGYLLTLMQRVARLEPEPLPEWDEYGELLRKGAVVTAVNLAYYVPYWLIIIALYIMQTVLSLAFTQSGSSSLGPFIAAPIGLTLLGYLITIPLGLLLGVTMPALHAQLALYDADFAAAFRLREIWGFINRHRGQYALAVALALAANYFLSFVGYLACCVGIFVTNFLVQLFQTHMLGQLCWYERVRASRLGSEYP